MRMNNLSEKSAGPEEVRNIISIQISHHKCNLQNRPRNYEHHGYTID
jgi:hypothetical protein